MNICDRLLDAIILLSGSSYSSMMHTEIYVSSLQLMYQMACIYASYDIDRSLRLYMRSYSRRWCQISYKLAVRYMKIYVIGYSQTMVLYATHMISGSSCNKMHSVLLQPANSIFSLTPNQHQSVSSTFLSQQISTSHQPQPTEQSDVVRTCHYMFLNFLFSALHGIAMRL